MKLKIKAFSLIELLVSVTIASIVITLALGTVGSVYFTQKRTEISQSFYAETRLLMEQIVQIVRNNTIDYDSYFIEIGPNPNLCGSFETKQLPADADTENNKTNRELYGYETIFYWDTNDDKKPDRNLGGFDQGNKAVGATGNDPCTQAFYGEQSVLYVINGARNKRVKVWAEEGRIKVVREAAVDEDGDLKVDRWTSVVKWDKATLSCVEAIKGIRTLGESTEGFCENIHDETIISPIAIEIQNLKFALSPDRDPFLSFRNNSVQVHPHVFISLSAVLKDYQKYGMDEDEAPRLAFQTSASSRVFGNPR